MKFTRKQLSRKQLAAFGLTPGKGPKPKTGTPLSPQAGKDNPIFTALCLAHGIEDVRYEVEFAPPRKWRFDVVFEGWLALEVQGGIWTGGRHVRGAALLKEMEKLNAAVEKGYSCIFCTPAEFNSGAVLETVKRCLKLEGKP